MVLKMLTNGAEQFSRFFFHVKHIHILMETNTERYKSTYMFTYSLTDESAGLIDTSISASISDAKL